MEHFSKQYADLQVQLLNLDKAVVAYEQGEQSVQNAQKLIDLFAKTFEQFAQVLAAYLREHHKNFSAGSSAHEIFANAHKAGFLAEHDFKILSQAAKESLEKASLAEIPLIHNIETYTDKIQELLREIKP